MGRLAALVGALLVVSLVVVSVAGAATGHRYAGQFSSAGTAPGDLDGPSGLAVNQSTGDVFVLDQGWSTGVPRVQRFDSSGAFELQWTGSATPAGNFSGPQAIAVDSSTGDVYVADTSNNVVARFDAAGAFECLVNDAGPSGCSATTTAGFSSPSGVAVDPSNGDVYVADSANNVVAVFDDTGAHVGSFDGSDNAAADGPFAYPTSIAVDANHDVYVLDSGKGRVERYAGLLGTATFVENLSVASPVAVAANPATGDVFVGSNGPSGAEVVHLDSAGEVLYRFGAGRIGGIGGLGVSSATGTVYVPDGSNGVVQRFAMFVAPDVAAGAASDVGAGEAILNGHLDPAGGSDIVACHFDYVDEATFQSSGFSAPSQAGCDQGSSFSSGADVTATVGGLSPNTTYRFRLVASNASGSNASAAETFTTHAAAPVVGGGLASQITTQAAKLNASVNPNGSETTYRFEYGTDTSYGQSTADASAGSTPGDQPVSADITDLQPGTVYHFRVVASNGTGGDVAGDDQTFATAPAQPAGATAIAATTATLTGTIDPQGGPATYHFEYGTTTAYGHSTAEADGGSTAGQKTVTTAVDGLSPATTYHVRVVATINGQTVTGADGTFTTAPAPTVTIGQPTDVTANAATLHATADTHGLTGATYTFTVTAADSPYASTTVPAPVPGDGVLSARVEDLPAGGSYTVQANVTAGGATRQSAPAAFSTPPAARNAAAPRAPGDLPPYPPQTPAAVDNRFTIDFSNVRGTRRRSTIKLTLPGPGVVTVAHRYLKTVRKTVSGGTVTITVRLNKAGRRALRRSRRHHKNVIYAVRYTPTGGTTATQHDTLTFKRKANK